MDLLNVDEKSKTYAYIRVSTKEQKEDRQLDVMKQYQISPENIFIDKQSGKDFERTQYQKMIHKMKSNSILYIKSIDRLGRNYSEIQEQWRIITKEKKSDIVVIDMPLLDTRQKKDLMGTFISDIILTLLSYIAENERMNIRQRQAEGIAAAKARGKKFGRPQLPVPDNFDKVYKAWKNKEITLTEAARLCNMPKSTFSYKVKNL